MNAPTLFETLQAIPDHRKRCLDRTFHFVGEASRVTGVLGSS